MGGRADDAATAQKATFQKNPKMRRKKKQKKEQIRLPFRFPYISSLGSLGIIIFLRGSFSSFSVSGAGGDWGCVYGERGTEMLRRRRERKEEKRRRALTHQCCLPPPPPPKMRGPNWWATHIFKSYYIGDCLFFTCLVSDLAVKYGARLGNTPETEL